MQVEYIDMVLIHVPKAFVPIPFLHPKTGISGKDWKPLREEAWRALAAGKKSGIVHNIGVSNFDIGHMEELNALDITKSGEAPIACNQFMHSPFSPSFAFEIADYCKEHGIAVVAHSSFAGMAHDKAFAHRVINEIKDNHAGLTTSAQVLLRWAIQMGYTVIPGSGNPRHQLDNLNIYSAQLSTQDMEMLRALRDDTNFPYMGHLRDDDDNTDSSSAKEEM